MQICLDEIISIKKIGPRETIDITVSDDNLFLANGILTHNSGYGSTDVDMTDVSESFGLAHTVDVLLALITTEELENLNQLMIKQLKNRYNDPNYYKRFVVGIDRSKMRLFDLEESAQKDIIDSGQDKDDDMPAFDKSSFGKRMKTAGTDFKF